MPTPSELLEQRRQELARIEREHELLLIAAFALVLDNLDRHLDELLGAIAVRREAGEPVTRSWILGSILFLTLLDQLRTRLVGFVDTATQATIVGQRTAGDLETTGILRAIVGEPPGGAAIAIRPAQQAPLHIGLASDGRPVAALLRASAFDGYAGVREALITGLLQGQGIEKVAREVRAAAAMTLLRSTTIASTEMHTAYREAVRQSVIENAELLEGWVWRAAKDRRTCAVCWTMDGTLFTFRAETLRAGVSYRAIDIMPTHPRCRCAMVPRAKSYAEILGDPTLPDSRVPLRRGPTIFAGLPWARQREILGPARHDLYRAGVPLEAMVHTVPDPTYGPTARLRRLDDLGNPSGAAFDRPIGELAQLRRDLGITTPEIARALHTDITAVARIEAGRASAVDELRYRIALDRLSQGEVGSLERAA